jgi:hypothetical protein
VSQPLSFPESSQSADLIDLSCLFLVTRTYQRSVFLHSPSPSSHTVLTTSLPQYYQLVPESTQSRQASQGRRIDHAPLSPAVFCPIPARILPPIVATPPTRSPYETIADTRRPHLFVHRSSPSKVEWHSPIEIPTWATPTRCPQRTLQSDIEPNHRAADRTRPGDWSGCSQGD